MLQTVAYKLLMHSGVASHTINADVKHTFPLYSGLLDSVAVPGLRRGLWSESTPKKHSLLY